MFSSIQRSEFMARSPALDFVNNLPQLPAFQ